MDFAAAAAKLKREQAARDERARQKLAKERQAEQRQRQRQQEREEAKRAQRLAEAAAAAAEEERHFEDLEANRGVALRVQLAAAPSDPADAARRGIKRAADKLVLPPSVGAELMSQGAPRNGAMLFEVAAANGGCTHAGVLEFTAPEGVVLLPPKVADCLWGLEEPQFRDPAGGEPSSSASSAGPPAPPAGARVSSSRPGGSGDGAAGAASSSGRCCGSVWVRYRVLPRCTFVRFQPELRAFHEVMGAAPDDTLRSMLEDCLLGYCTLSEGDWVQLRYEGQTYNLRVLELQPGPAVSVLDTEVAAEVGPSIETEGYLRQQAEAAAREAQRHRQAAEEAARAQAEAEAAEQAAAAAEARRQAEEAARRLHAQGRAAALVAPEVEADSPEPHAALLFRLPDGSRLSRRFRLVQHVQELYDFLDSKGAGGLWPGSYSLVLQFPRRVLGAGPDGPRASLEGEGLEAGSQQAVFVEALPSAAA